MYFMKDSAAEWWSMMVTFLLLNRKGARRRVTRGVRRVAGELQGSRMDPEAWQSVKMECNPLDPFSLMTINTQMQRYSQSL